MAVPAERLVQRDKFSPARGSWVDASSQPPGSNEASFDDRVKEELAPEFRVVRKLGAGSVANVYLANDVELEQLRAIKVLVPSKSFDETARKRFKREAKAAAKIAHASVTSVLRVGSLSDDIPFLVMEYVDGRNLEDVIAGGGPLNEEEGRDVLRQLAEGLAAAHAQGIIHRDLKPSNILRESSTGDVRLTDFGLAAARDAAGSDTTRLTVQGQILGEVEYVAPEHLMGEDLTELADVYSLGVIGYRVLSGKTPYPDARNAQIISEKLRSPPAPLAELVPGVSPDLAALLEQCLSRKPEHRPSAADVANRLAGLGADAPPASHASVHQGVPPARPQTPFEIFFEELRRRRVYRVGGAYLALIVAVVGLLDGISNAFDISSTAQQWIIVITMIGLPVTLCLAWMFDIRQGRVERTADTPVEGGPRLSRMLPVLALLASLTIAALGVWLLI